MDFKDCTPEVTTVGYDKVNTLTGLCLYVAQRMRDEGFRRREDNGVLWAMARALESADMYCDKALVEINGLIRQDKLAFMSTFEVLNKAVLAAETFSRKSIISEIVDNVDLYFKWVERKKSHQEAAKLLRRCTAFDGLLGLDTAPEGTLDGSMARLVHHLQGLSVMHKRVEAKLGLLDWQPLGDFKGFEDSQVLLTRMGEPYICTGEWSVSDCAWLWGSEDPPTHYARVKGVPAETETSV